MVLPPPPLTNISAKNVSLFCTAPLMETNLKYEMIIKCIMILTSKGRKFNIQRGGWDEWLFILLSPFTPGSSTYKNKFILVVEPLRGMGGGLKPLNHWRKPLLKGGIWGGNVTFVAPLFFKTIMTKCRNSGSWQFLEFI